jgi:hypothetical protein
MQRQKYMIDSVNDRDSKKPLPAFTALSKPEARYLACVTAHD